MSYGTGEIPFVRTSDISNWEIKTDPKQGVSDEIHAKFSKRQDVKEGDIFFVRDGTYLVGQSCMVTRYDLPCLFQSHILRFRLSEHAPFNRYLLLAMLNSPVVRLQIKARQFTADIIDTIGNRYLEIQLPVPKQRQRQNRIASATANIIESRTSLREAIRKIPLLAQGIIKGMDESIPERLTQNGTEEGNLGFPFAYNNITGAIFLPRYYNPTIESELRELSRTHELVSISELVKEKVLSWTTGIEIGKMAYGTGPVPFVRTSDISNWELKADPKQSVSEDIYLHYEAKQDVKADDIFVVRDGTYLVGTSCIITEHDTKILYCGGLYKFRVNRQNKLDPYLLLALLNMPIVRRQMRAKQFTRDIIDTLGKRIFEVVLPIPKHVQISKQVAETARKTVQTRVNLRIETKKIALDVEGLTSIPDEVIELVETI
jgi:restriction endonuclease S subunit